MLQWPNSYSIGSHMALLNPPSHSIFRHNSPLYTPPPPPPNDDIKLWFSRGEYWKSTIFWRCRMESMFSTANKDVLSRRHSKNYDFSLSNEFHHYCPLLCLKRSWSNFYLKLRSNYNSLSLHWIRWNFHFIATKNAKKSFPKQVPN